MSLVDDYLQSFLAASLGERLALVALVLALAIVLRQVLRARQPDTPAPALAALGERLEMTTRRAEAAEDEARQLASLLNALPGPVWQRDATGVLIWANRCFHGLSSADIAALDAAAPGDLLRPTSAQMQVFERGGGPSEGGQGAESPQFALPADRLFETQNALKRFVETLTQTRPGWRPARAFVASWKSCATRAICRKEPISSHGSNSCKPLSMAPPRPAIPIPGFCPAGVRCG